MRVEREAAVGPVAEGERAARREPDEGAGGAKGETRRRFGQTRSPAEFRVAERTRLKLYSESCSRPTLQSRDPRRSRLVAKETLTITDNRTGRTYEVPIEDETIRATDLRQIKVKDDDFGLMTYDPAFMNTAACRSAITYIDGDKGILRYRGYPIEQLAERATFLEVAYLLERGRAADQGPARRVDGDDQVPHLRPHQHHQVPRGVPLRRAPDGHAAGRGRRAVDLLSRRQEHPRPGQSLPPAGAAAGQGADHRRLRVPPFARAAVRLPGQRSRLHRQLRQHDVQHRRPCTSPTRCCSARSRSC